VNTGAGPERPVGGSASGGNNVALCVFAILAVVLHLTVSACAQFGIFRDELYYIACANHPAAGYVDHPPLSIWILGAWKAFFGDSLFSIRFLPALCAGLTTLIAGSLARAFGGGRYAISLSCLAAIFAPIYLAFFGLYTMNAFDVTLWAAAFLLLQRIARGGGPRDWFILGVALGLGALNKISMLWLAAGIFLSTLATDRRPVLRTATPWLSGLLALTIFLPFIVWNFTHDFAHLDFIRIASSAKYASQNPATFFLGLPLMVGPAAVPLLVGGFWLLLARKEFRLTGISVLCVLVILLVNVHSKPEYFAAAMAALIPAGAVQMERWLDAGWVRAARIPYAVLLTAAGLAFSPLTLDFLPVDAYIRYEAALGVKAPSTEGQEMGDLPQHYADRFGWKELTAEVARVYAALPDSDRARCLIYGRNYGEAAAIDYYGREYGLPPAISRHNSYWYWSVGRLRQDATIIVIGVRPGDLARDFNEVVEAGVARADHVMPYENNLVITVCRGFRRPVMEVWSAGKLFI
jgi:hypothetical protein